MQREAEEKESWTTGNEVDPLPELTRREKRIEADKKRLKWRKSLDEDDTIFKSKLGAFNVNENDLSFLEMMQQPWDLRPKTIKKWYAAQKLQSEAFGQGYIRQRVDILGHDLATAHFITFRKGKVRFKGDPNWHTDELALPRKFDPAYHVEAINFDGLNLHYEGVQNLDGLLHCKSISLRGCRYFDTWGLDRLSGNCLPMLEELDIAETDISLGALGAIYRFSALKRLIVDKEKNNSIDWRLTYAMLEEMNPNLQVLDTKDVVKS